MENQQDRLSYIKRIRQNEDNLYNDEGSKLKSDILIYTLPPEVLTEITKYNLWSWYLVSRHFSEITKYQLIRYRISKCEIECEDIIKSIRIDAVEDDNNTIEGLVKACLLSGLAAHGDFSAIQFFVDVNHYDIKLKNIHGDSLLHIALEQNQVKLAQKLISEYQLDINEQNDIEETPLHVACYKGQYDAVKFTLSEGADVNATNHYGHTPLHTALIQDWNDIAKLLIDEYHADVNKRSYSGTTALHFAVFHDFVDIIDLLYTESNNISSACGKLAFHEVRSVKMIQKFIDLGMDINVIDETGKTLLHHLAICKYIEFITFVLTIKDVDTTITDYRGYSYNDYLLE